MKLILLQIILSELNKNKKLKIYRLGICWEIDTLPLKYDRIIIVDFRRWFETQKPSSILHTNFTKSPHFLDANFWWERTELGLEQRILFIKYLIEQNS